MPCVVVAAQHNASLAERLARHLGGVALHEVTGEVEAERAVAIVEGGDLERVAAAMRRVHAPMTRAVNLGGDDAVVSWVLGGCEVVRVDGDAGPALLWRALVQATEATFDVRAPIPSEPRRLPKLFLSHAASDEAELSSAVAVVRRMGLEVFVCGDSIGDGERWWDTIVSSLHACDVFVLVLSPASRASTWCAFEAGAAIALGKRVRLVSLDGASPPTFVAQLQMHDVARTLRMRPWLTRDDVLVEALSSPAPGEA